MGAAMHGVYADLKNVMGMQMSDTEEKAEEDEDYKNMTLVKNKYLNRKRRDSDTSMNTAYQQKKEDLYLVSRINPILI